MKSNTVTIPDELDLQVAAESRRRGISKSELIRLGLVKMLSDAAASTEADPWRDLAGFAPEHLTTEPDDIDEVVYRS
ncbi:MAG: ribbon-helix-helix domain-containing protein [Actinomycetota bacterium]|nr:ribbon-helix-helix domain-containing protein [Actinomycetota bacterium]